MAGIKQVSFTTPYSAEEVDIERNRRLADALRKQAATPLETNRMVGRVAIPISPWEGAAKLAQGLSAGYQEEQATKRQKALGDRYRADRSSDMATLAAMLRGAPATSENIIDEQAAGGEGAPATINAPARPGGIDPAMLGQLRTQSGQQLGDQLMLEQLKPQKPVVVGRSLLDPSGKTIGVDSTWQAEQETARKAKEAELQAKLADAKVSREYHAQAH